MGLPLQGSLAAAADAAIQRVAEQMTSQHVSNTLLASANGSWQLSSAAATVLLQQLEQVLPQATPQEVANSLWAAAKLGLRLSDSLKVPLQQQLERVLPQAEPQHVANSLWALSKLEWRLQGSLAAAADAAIQRVAEQMTSQHVSNMLWALATASWQLSSAAAAALLQRLEQVLPQANAQEVANSLWAAAKLGLQLSGSLKAAFAPALRRIMPAARAMQLSSSVLACGILRWSPDEGVLEAAVAAMQRCLESEQGMTCQALSNILWGLAELQQHAGAKLQLLPTLPSLLEAACDWAGSRGGQLSALDVCALCYNLARLGHRPDGTWIEHAAQRLLECIDLGLHGRYGCFIWACSTWGHRLPHSALELLVPAAVDSVCCADSSGGAILLVEALTRQDFKVGPNFPAATAALKRLLPLVYAHIDRTSRLEWEMEAMTYLAGMAGGLTDLGVLLPAPQLEAISRYAAQHVQQLRQAERSHLQRAFEAAAYERGLAVLRQGPVAS